MLLNYYQVVVSDGLKVFYGSRLFIVVGSMSSASAFHRLNTSSGFCENPMNTGTKVEWSRVAVIPDSIPRCSFIASRGARIVGPATLIQCVISSSIGGTRYVENGSYCRCFEHVELEASSF
jgi:hypothetical protein